MAKKALKPIKTVASAGWTETGLPTPEQVEQTAQQISAATTATQEPEQTTSPQAERATRAKKSFKRPDPAKIKRPPTAATAKGRVKFTTMLHPSLRSILLAVSIEQRRTVADVLEVCLMEYFDVTQKELDKLKRADV